MPRSALVYLSDITGACEVVGRFLDDVDFATYREAELVRSGVERQLITIGEAVRLAPAPRAGALRPHLARAPHRRLPQPLAHDYAAVNDAVVWAIATDEVPVLLEECAALLAEMTSGSEAD